jgi:hypothetical protein
VKDPEVLAGRQDHNQLILRLRLGTHEERKQDEEDD